MILKDPIAIEAAERFQQRVDALRAEYPGLANVRATCLLDDVLYFDLLAQAMEVTLVPTVEPIREADCLHPSLDTMQGGFPWVCDHYPWPNGADGSGLAPVMQIRLADLRPHVQVEFPDLLVQVWAEEWEMTTRTVPMDHARTCKCPGAREAYVGRLIWFRSRTRVAEAEYEQVPDDLILVYRCVESPERNGPETIVGFRLGCLRLGRVSVLPQMISQGQVIDVLDDFVSFGPEPLEFSTQAFRALSERFNAALDALEKMQLSDAQTSIIPQQQEGQDRGLDVGEFFCFPWLWHYDLPDDVAKGWRPLFTCHDDQHGLHLRAIAQFYVAYRCSGEGFEFMAILSNNN